jgi:hypothetical protein
LNKPINESLQNRNNRKETEKRNAQKRKPFRPSRIAASAMWALEQGVSHLANYRKTKMIDSEKGVKLYDVCACSTIVKNDGWIPKHKMKELGCLQEVTKQQFNHLNAIMVKDALEQKLPEQPTSEPSSPEQPTSEPSSPE